jgi:hypothetical protein
VVRHAASNMTRSTLNPLSMTLTVLIGGPGSGGAVDR